MSNGMMDRRPGTAALPEHVTENIRRMLVDADTCDRLEAGAIVARMLAARRARVAPGPQEIERILGCLDELELLFSLELTGIERELDHRQAAAVVELFPGRRLA